MGLSSKHAKNVQKAIFNEFVMNGNKYGVISAGLTSRNTILIRIKSNITVKQKREIFNVASKAIPKNKLRHYHLNYYKPRPPEMF